MIISERKLKELDSLLKREEKDDISNAVEVLREEEPFSGAISLLTSLYDKSDDTLVKKSIEKFMNDLKDQTACEEVVTELKKPWKPSTISMLVSSCWQSGLDYSEFSLYFTELFVKTDYITAIECLTVIEEAVHYLTKEKKSEIIKYIQDNYLTNPDEKRELTIELMSILKG